MNRKMSINSTCPNLWAPTAGLLQGLAACRAAMCLPDEVYQCL